ncbi:tyrosine-type recombinase/integrase [Candidatus Enterococcus ferrettii]|uniref:Site-specific integrase n=1 Tax=Candidatus Enterococcus ferrettii TaxID=2815324 RepID=A0ABV0ETG5_9ENTE|nr:site-specific integrase [Enterococcus sp. 665A]MBO1342174.1 site-specific integrase [Enterococcus sp. 665A]
MGRKGENIYFRKDERWEGRYHKGRKANGRIKYGYVYGKTYEEVQKKLTPLKKNAEIMLRLYGKSIMEFHEWSGQLLEDWQANLKVSTYSSYRHKLKNYLWEQLGDLSLYQLDEQNIGKAVEAWRLQGLSLSSIKSIFRVLNKTLNQAVKQGILEKNPCTLVQLPKAMKSKVQALSRNQQKKLKKVAEADHDNRSAAVILAMETGMRIGEIAALTWDEVDFEQSMIYVNHTYQRVTDNQGTKLHLGSAKTEAAQRSVPMSGTVRDILLRLKIQASEETFVFTTNGKPCEPRLLTYHFHRIRKKARLEKVHFHQLRHTFATRCLEATADVLAVSRILGHSSTKMTLDTYGHSIQEQQVAAVQAMTRAIA